MNKFCFSLLSLIFVSTLMAGSVKGRYIYFGNALSERMSLVEIEVFSQGKNVIRNRPEVFTAGLDYRFYMLKRSPKEKAAAARMLVDGDVDTSKRGVDLGSKISAGYLDITLRYTSLEIDLGSEIPVDTIVIYRSQYTKKQWHDLGWRVLVLLDESRRIVSWKAFNVYGPGWKENKGRWAFDMTPATGKPAGRVVPKGARSWLSEAEYIRDFLGKPVVDLVKNQTPEQKARLAKFAKRNSPENIAALGKSFFRLVDLSRPELKTVKKWVDAGNYAAALEAFKRPFIERLEKPFKDWNAGEGTSIYVFYTWNTEPDTRATCRARDLRNYVYADKKTLTVKRFIPGLLPKTKFTFPMQTRPLLLNYAVTKRMEDLRLWETMTDDWAMGWQDAADKDPRNLRDYFVLDIGSIRKNLRDLYMTYRSNPKFIDELSGATLARLLMPVIEELPVANWRVIRKVTFNHTYNAIPAGIHVAELLAQFYAGQRLEQEMRQAFERLYTYNQYRDGSMVEIGDEGHFLAPVCSPGYLYGEFVHMGRPSWFTPGLETYFLDNYRENILSQVRNIAPCGAHVRWNGKNDDLLSFSYTLDIKDPYWRNVCGNRMSWGDYYTKLTVPILKEPEPRAFIDTVYGRGRPPFKSKRKREEQEAVARVYGGSYQGRPKTLSDWMPYSGLWYFRGSWDHDASFLHMISPSAPNNLGKLWYFITNVYSKEQFDTTSYRFYDYATPLVTCTGVRVDNLPPCPEEKVFPSGSKQDCFSQATEKPQNGRWYTDAELDFGEAIYKGVYRVARLDWDNKRRKSVVKFSKERVAGVTTTRQIYQVRPARLFFQLDRLRYATPNEEHTQTLENTFVITEPDEKTGKTISEDQVQVLQAQKRVVMDNPGNAGLTVAWFGQPVEIIHSRKKLHHPSADKLGGPSITYNGYRRTMGTQVLTRWKGKGETAILSVLRANKPGDKPIRKLVDLSTSAVIGASVITDNGVKTTLMVSRKGTTTLTIGQLSAVGEALLLVEEPGKQPIGLALGAKTLELRGIPKKLIAEDIRFTLDNTFTQSEIRRPIDPPTIAPAVNTFTDSTMVTISSATPNVDIYYIAENNPQTGDKVGGPARASVHATNWVRYTRPSRITGNTFIRARAFRKGVTKIPFTAAGTDVSAISYAFFYKRAPLQAITPPARLRPGLNYDYLEGRWFKLWTYTDQLEAKSTGHVDKLLDVSMRKTDGPFAVRYHGYIDIPRDGVYTFYGPREFVNNICEPGYDLRVFIDGEEWYLGQTWHGRGMWSIPLKKGLHKFRLTFADARARDLQNQRIDLWRHYPWPQTTWKGTVPTVEISGPGLKRQPIPNAWFKSP